MVIELGNLGNDLANDDWGITSGQIIGDPDPNDEFDIDLPNIFTITINEELDQNGSNLAIMLTLAHELIHAYMFDTLSDAGYITFNSNNGGPILTQVQINNLNCNFDIPTPTSTFLNDYSESERFAILMCTMIYTGTAQNTDWSHSLFGDYNFSVNTYQQQLADFIFENHDWDSESSNFENEAMNVFGSNWKIEVSKAASWIGLELTSQYTDYLSNYSGPNNFQKLQYVAGIKGKISNANSNCQ